MVSSRATVNRSTQAAGRSHCYTAQAMHSAYLACDRFQSVAGKRTNFLPNRSNWQKGRGRYMHQCSRVGAATVRGDFVHSTSGLKRSCPTVVPGNRDVRKRCLCPEASYAFITDLIPRQPRPTRPPNIRSRFAWARFFRCWLTPYAASAPGCVTSRMTKSRFRPIFTKSSWPTSIAAARAPDGPGRSRNKYTKPGAACRIRFFVCCVRHDAQRHDLTLQPESKSDPGIDWPGESPGGDSDDGNS